MQIYKKEPKVETFIKISNCSYVQFTFLSLKNSSHHRHICPVRLIHTGTPTKYMPDATNIYTYHGVYIYLSRCEYMPTGVCIYAYRGEYICLPRWTYMSATISIIPDTIDLKTTATRKREKNRVILKILSFSLANQQSIFKFAKNVTV